MYWADLDKVDHDFECARDDELDRRIEVEESKGKSHEQAFHDAVARWDAERKAEYMKDDGDERPLEDIVNSILKGWFANV